MIWERLFKQQQKKKKLERDSVATMEMRGDIGRKGPVICGDPDPTSGFVNNIYVLSLGTRLLERGASAREKEHLRPSFDLLSNPSSHLVNSPLLQV